MRVGVGTIVAGRRDHLARQTSALRDAGVARRVVAAMDDAPVAAAGAEIVRVAPGRGGLPLAAARNAALRALADCDLAILLDVDCIPGRELVERYVAAAAGPGPGREGGGAGDGLICGPVGYLRAPVGPGGPDAMTRRDARARVIRDFPLAGVRREPRSELFWSLSFAVRPAVHDRIGGFDEGYRGWGAEDTDYALRARAAGVALWFAGGAWAYHQPHAPVFREDPAAVAALAANARRFHVRWGFWPMPRVLERLAGEGRLDWEPDGVGCEARPGADIRAAPPVARR